MTPNKAIAPQTRAADGANGGGATVSDFRPVGAKVFREFPKRLMVGATQPMFLIVDGHPAHKAKLVQDFVNAQEGKLKLFFSYSPQLNPDEQVWNQEPCRQGRSAEHDRTEEDAHQRPAAFAETPRRCPRLLTPSGLPLCGYMTLLAIPLVNPQHRFNRHQRPTASTRLRVVRLDHEPAVLPTARPRPSRPGKAPGGSVSFSDRGPTRRR